MAPTTAVQAGEAIRIMTGAPMPDGADAVVMVERTHASGDRVAILEAAARPATTYGTRAATSRSASSCSRQEPCSRPRTSACSASLDVADVWCHPRPRVGVCSTGDELVASWPACRA